MAQLFTWPVVTVVASTVLPPGIATEAKQDTGNASLDSIDTKLDDQATAAKQDTGNASLSSIDGKVATAAKQDTGNTSLSSIDGKVSTAAKQDTGNTSLNNIDGKLGGLVDANNSSTTPLGGGATFTGTATDVTNMAGIKVMVFADQSSAPAGLKLQFSMDGTNWDEQVTQTFTTGGNAISVSTPVRAKYFRVVYINGATPQSTFRLQTLLNRASVSGDALEMTDTVSGDDHALLTRGQIVGRSTTANTTFREAFVDTSNRLQVNVGTSALPTGAATSANQTTANNSLASIDGKMAALGQGAMAASMPVVIASDQSRVKTEPAAKTAVDKARNAYGTGNVTTAAYTQLIASTAGAATEIEIFDSSGQTLLLAIGGVGAEVDKIYIMPGGNGRVPLAIPASSRVSIKAVSGTANAGEIDINLYG